MIKRIFLAVLLVLTLPLIAQGNDSETVVTELISESQLLLAATPGDGKITLKWATARQFTNRMFFLERSVDGEQFTVLTQFTGRTSQTGPRLFDFIDGMVENQARYCYRIASLQPDGNMAYSESVWITAAPVYTDLQH